MALRGVGIGRGIVIGRVQLLRARQPQVVEQQLPSTQLDAEVARYLAAVDTTHTALCGIRAAIPDSTPTDIAAFIDAHLLMLQDSALTEAVTHLIRTQGCNAEWALQQQRDALVQVFDEMDDAYLRSRRNDVEHVVERIQRSLLNQEAELSPITAAGETTILVTDDLAPADVVSLHSQGRLQAFVCEFGGPLSHTAILARSLRLPSIVGLRNAQQLLRDGERIILDCANGTVIAGPDARAIAQYEQRRREEADWQQSLQALRSHPSVTADGISVSLRANIELPQDMQAANDFGAEGIGLYRTEFLYLGRSAHPDEEAHVQAYRAVIQAAAGAPVTVRTLDLGADKQIDGGRSDTPMAINPALGLRAIRLCLREPGLFRPQLRALFRVAAEGPLRIMLPMVSNLQELRQCHAIISDVRRELIAEGLPCGDNVPVGAMIEIPAAALVADQLAQQVDFFSIGTNDLIQYTLAIDRVDDEVNYLYDPLHPAVLRLIEMTIAAGQRANIPVALCGEMAGDPRYTRLLLALGLREFSMHPSSLLEVKASVLRACCEPMAALRSQLLAAPDAATVAALLDNLAIHDSQELSA